MSTKKFRSHRKNECRVMFANIHHASESIHPSTLRKLCNNWNKVSDNQLFWNFFKKILRWKYSFLYAIQFCTLHQIIPVKVINKRVIYAEVLEKDSLPDWLSVLQVSTHVVEKSCYNSIQTCLCAETTTGQHVANGFSNFKVKVLTKYCESCNER